MSPGRTASVPFAAECVAAVDELIAAKMGRTLTRVSGSLTQRMQSLPRMRRSLPRRRYVNGECYRLAGRAEACEAGEHKSVRQASARSAPAAAGSPATNGRAGSGDRPASIPTSIAAVR